jgi:hypothetical protein
MMRVPSELWVRALLRRCSAAGVPVVVVRRGDEDAGAVFIKIRLLDGRAKVMGPVPAGLARSSALKPMATHLDADGVPEADADAYLSRQHQFDPDIWLIEIEDRAGRTFSDD